MQARREDSGRTAYLVGWALAFVVVGETEHWEARLQPWLIMARWQIWQSRLEPSFDFV